MGKKSEESKRIRKGMSSPYKLRRMFSRTTAERDFLSPPSKPSN